MGHRFWAPLHKLKPVHLCYTTMMWRVETNVSCKQTLTIYTKEVTYMLARRQRLDGSSTTAIPQSVMSN